MFEEELIILSTILALFTGAMAANYTIQPTTKKEENFKIEIVRFEHIEVPPPPEKADFFSSVCWRLIWNDSTRYAVPPYNCKDSTVQYY